MIACLKFKGMPRPTTVIERLLFLLPTVATVPTAITTPSAVTAAMPTAPRKTNRGHVKEGKTANDGGDKDDSSGANVKSVSKKRKLADMKAGEDDEETDHDDKAIKEEIDK
jgi:hypothetical protein